MKSLPLVVIDACVLANFSLCDTLLRLAEPPRLYEPRWSEEIIRETTRTLELKLGWPSALTAHLEVYSSPQIDEPPTRASNATLKTESSLRTGSAAASRPIESTRRPEYRRRYPAGPGSCDSEG